ncbi:unannotated protein [freshwater metagenome]|uniref:Unannotated protein n=1 Tax=freshwater metagenome TaxID=449393 RepID=A0A6J7E564_9ZZZZ|nr:hypothetical protein [Actinomycetota bacterium]MUH58594.1 hypothetical protein [Actinomycetota bacterium]
MQATLLLSDSAEVHNGRLYLMGGGLTWIWANFPTPMSVAGLFNLEHSELGRELQVSIRIFQEDGSPALGTDAGGNTFEYGFSDTITTPSNDVTYDAELDFVWSAKWFGLNLAPGVYQMCLISEETGETVGHQHFTAYASNN